MDMARRLLPLHIRAYMATRTISTSGKRFEIREIKDLGFAPKFKDQYSETRVEKPTPLVSNGRLTQYALFAAFFFTVGKFYYWLYQKDCEYLRNYEFEESENRKGTGLPKIEYKL